MATTMIRHPLTSSWTKIGSGATGVALQGFVQTYLVHLGNDTPAPGSSGMMAAPGEEAFVISNLPAVDVWVRSCNPMHDGNIVNGMVF